MVHTVGEQSGAGERKVSRPLGLIVPQGDYIHIRITKAWELRAGLGNPNTTTSSCHTRCDAICYNTHILTAHNGTYIKDRCSSGKACFRLTIIRIFVHCTC